MARLRKLQDRLAGYWKLEAANILFVPFFVVVVSDGAIGPLTIGALVPVMGLLAIGAAYWRAKHAQITWQQSPDALIALLALWRIPLLVLTIAASAAVAAAHIWGIAARGQADLLAATAMAVLAILEYANYYWRQLQHFDHLADIKRLLTGRGFRKSQLRQDLERLGLR